MHGTEAGAAMTLGTGGQRRMASTTLQEHMFDLCGFCEGGVASRACARGAVGAQLMLGSVSTSGEGQRGWRRFR